MAMQRRFQRHERLLQSRDYTSVFSGTHCKSSDQYLTVLAKHNHRQHPRLGLAITKKKIRNAIARNRVKRIVRESFRHHKQHLADLDVVVLAQSRAATVPAKVLFNSLQNHWLKLAQRCKN